MNEEKIRQYLRGDSDLSLEFCKGSNAGRAIYLFDESSKSGYRAAGGKCWGFIERIFSASLDLRGINEMIDMLEKEKQKILKVQSEYYEEEVEE